jgi:hypothetical protein
MQLLSVWDSWGTETCQKREKILKYLGIQLYAGFTLRWSPLGGRNSKKACETDVIKLPVRQQQWSGGWRKYNTL